MLVRPEIMMAMSQASKPTEAQRKKLEDDEKKRMVQKAKRATVVMNDF